MRERTRGGAYGLVSAMMAVAAAASPMAGQAPAKDAPGAVTLTLEGCLTKEGSAERSSAAEQFVLRVLRGAPAIEGAKDTPSAPTTAGESHGAKAPAPPHEPMYVLRSAPEAPRSFNTMINHHVRITGTSTAPATTAPLAGRSPEATPYEAPVATPSRSTSSTAPTGTAFDTANLPTLVVHGITSVASSCK